MSNVKFKPIRLQVASKLPPLARRVVTVGVPLPVGVSTEASDLCICNSQDKCLPSVIDVTSRWGDGSIRWCTARFLSDQSASEFTLQPRAGRTNEERSLLKVSETDGLSVSVDGSTYRFFSGSRFPAIETVETHLVDSGEVHITNEDGASVQCEFEPPKLVSHDDLTAVVRIQGMAAFGDNHSLNLILSYQIFADRRLSVTVGVHNPGRAQHNDGIWDLGDSGSVFIDRFVLELACTKANDILLQTESDSEWLSQATHSAMQLYQACLLYTSPSPRDS